MDVALDAASVVQSIHVDTSTNGVAGPNALLSAGSKADSESQTCRVCNGIDEVLLVNDNEEDEAGDAARNVGGKSKGKSDDQSIRRRRGLNEHLWISCDQCMAWFHARCLDLDEIDLNLIREFHCSGCTAAAPAFHWRQVKCPHRIHFDVESEAGLETEVGTKTWIEEFSKTESLITAAPPDVLPVFADGDEFMAAFDKEAPWTKPYKIINRTGLEMRMPDADFTIEDCVKIVGADEEISIIDVYMQRSAKMRFAKFYEKWIDPRRERLFNMLSLEFSHTKLYDMIMAPRLMYDLSWVHNLWSDKPAWRDDGFDSDEDDESHELETQLFGFRPDVAMFCLLGMKGSYTDFHIDFGGSSVWYHVLKGKKIFYVVEPTDEHLHLFETWTNDPNTSTVFYGKLIDPTKLFRVEVNAGETLMIPSGWIHAVLTPEDSIVFGGNFIHELDIEMQLKVYDIEMKCNYDEQFKFPNFELVNWFAAYTLSDRLLGANEERIRLPKYLIDGLRTLLRYLQIWFVEVEKSKNQEFLDANTRQTLKIRTKGFKKICSSLKQQLAKYDERVSRSPRGKDPLKVRISLKAPPKVDEEAMKRKIERKYERLKEKDGKLPKKDIQAVSGIFSTTPSSGRKIKTTAVVKAALEPEAEEEYEEEPQPSSKSFFAGMSEEVRQRIAYVDKVANAEARKLGDSAVDSDDDDFLPPKAKKQNRRPKEKTEKPAAPKPKPKVGVQDRIRNKMKLLKKHR